MNKTTIKGVLIKMVNDLPNITKVAVSLANHSKMLVLDSLMDKRGHTLLEIARFANIKPQTASYHLKSFIENKWVRKEKVGRFHYFFLISQQVALLIEQFSPIAPCNKTKTKIKAAKAEKAINFRSCYDHMAGKIGVLITDLLLNNSFINETNDGYKVTSKGVPFFEHALHIDLQQTYVKKRKFTVKCLDWSERRYHLGGALGNAVFNAFIKQALIARDPLTKRALFLTKSGKSFLEEELNYPNALEVEGKVIPK